MSTSVFPWEAFKVGTPATKGFSNDCKPFTTVTHTSHIDQALKILEAGKIRQYLVFDESMLNNQRILVSWLSPNYWSSGFRYGNVMFDFNFSSLIEKKKFYWVESIAYTIPACRILVTNKDHDHHLIPYDPATKGGPWWQDPSDGRHYFNGGYCLEFMFEQDIELQHMSGFFFVDHHSAYCSVNRNNPEKCPERGLKASPAGGRFICRAITASTPLDTIKPYLVTTKGRPSNELEFAFSDLLRRATFNVEFEGNLTSVDEPGFAVARSIMALHAYGSSADVKALSSLFASEDHVSQSLAMMVAEACDLEDWKTLLD